MKKFLPIALMATVLSAGAFNANANIHRVGYPGPAINGVDQPDLQTAVNNVNSGDTIYLYPGNWNADITQKVVIIGYGYFLNKTTNNNANGVPNTGLQVINTDMSVNITLDYNSDNSIFEGLEGANISSYTNESGWANVGGITIDCCEGSVAFYGDGSKAINGWTITRSWLQIASYQGSGGAPLITNLTVNNCWIGNCDFSIASNGLQQTGLFTNDIFATVNNTLNFNSGGFVVQNSIFMGAAQGDGSVTYNYNLSNSDAGWSAIGNGKGSGNIAASFKAKQVFIDYPTTNQGITPANKYSPDGGLAFYSSSPAKGKGMGGTDMGIFGGTNPYLLSGIPPVPTFYKLSAGSINATSNPYTVTFSVRSNN